MKMMENITLNGIEYTPVIKEIEEVFLSLEQSLKFIIYHKDLGEMNYNDAVQSCEALGEGWRLPTRAELLLIYENREKITFLAANCYWSSTEDNNCNAWLQNFFNGTQGNTNKDRYNVRAVRAVRTICN